MKIAVIGCGVMGGAFAAHFAKEHAVVLYDKVPGKAAMLAQGFTATVCETALTAVKGADVILLGIKPADLSALALEIGEAMSKEQLIISILAGTKVTVLKSSFPGAEMIRIMPNLGIAYGEGVVGVVEEKCLETKIRQKLEALFKGLGLVRWLDEEKLDALTALTGSGPAFVFVFVEAMIESGILLGFSAQESREFALKTIRGSMALLEGTGKHPGELACQIASPGGTTIAGLKALEDFGFKSAVLNAFQASCDRSRNFFKNS